MEAKSPAAIPTSASEERPARSRARPRSRCRSLNASSFIARKSASDRGPREVFRAARGRGSGEHHVWSILQLSFGLVVVAILLVIALAVAASPLLAVIIAAVIAVFLLVGMTARRRRSARGGRSRGRCLRYSNDRPRGPARHPPPPERRTSLGRRLGRPPARDVPPAADSRARRASRRGSRASRGSPRGTCGWPIRRASPGGSAAVPFLDSGIRENAFAAAIRSSSRRPGSMPTISAMRARALVRVVLHLVADQDAASGGGAGVGLLHDLGPVQPDARLPSDQRRAPSVVQGIRALLGGPAPVPVCVEPGVDDVAAVPQKEDQIRLREQVHDRIGVRPGLLDDDHRVLDPARVLDVLGGLRLEAGADQLPELGGSSDRGSDRRRR